MTTDIDTSITMTTDSSDSNSINIAKQNEKIEKWLNKKTEKEILFMLLSTSGQLATMYDQYGSITRPIRISMDSKYLIMGEQTILLSKNTIDISIGINTLSKTDSNNNNHIDTENNKNNSNNNCNNNRHQLNTPKHNKITDMKKEELDDYVFQVLNADYGYYDFDDVNKNNMMTRLIASNLENCAIHSQNIIPRHCITLHINNNKNGLINEQDIVLEFPNVQQRYLWAKGLSKLIKMNSKHRKHRYKAISYLLGKHSKALNYHAARAVNFQYNSDQLSNEAEKYFANRRQYGSLMNRYIFVKTFRKQAANPESYNDEINMDLMPLARYQNDFCLMGQMKFLWNSMFDPECKYVRKLPRKYAALYRRHVKRQQNDASAHFDVDLQML